MTKASQLVAQLEIQVAQMEARLRKKDERLKTLSGHIQELKARIRKLESESHANQTWLTWQKGYPTVPGLYRLKYEDGTVIVRELCFRVMNQTRRYLGFANEFAHPIEDDEDLIAWAGPIPEPGE